MNLESVLKILMNDDSNSSFIQIFAICFLNCLHLNKNLTYGKVLCENIFELEHHLYLSIIIKILKKNMNPSNGLSAFNGNSF